MVFAAGAAAATATAADWDIDVAPKQLKSLVPDSGSCSYYVQLGFLDFLVQLGTVLVPVPVLVLVLVRVLAAADAVDTASDSFPHPRRRSEADSGTGKAVDQTMDFLLLLLDKVASEWEGEGRNPVVHH